MKYINFNPSPGDIYEQRHNREEIFLRNNVLVTSDIKRNYVLIFKNIFLVILPLYIFIAIF